MAKLLDSHIHLWPSTSTSPTHHAWMTPGHPLARRRGISDYQRAAWLQATGFVYVETDRYLPSPSPCIPVSDIRAAAAGDSQAKQGVLTKLEAWAREPLAELRFLKRIVESASEGETDGFSSRDGDQMLAMVIWAPLHLPRFLFQLYLDIAATVAGDACWARVAGFRYLIQGIQKESEMRKMLLENEDWVENMLSLREGRGGRGWSFDVGVDTRSGGVWQLEVAAEMIERTRQEEGMRGGGHVRFILNHLCKPDLANPRSPAFDRWAAALERLSALPAVYMKLSGLFSEFSDRAPSSIDEIIQQIYAYALKTFSLFGPQKIMFGSDWPVCNVNGPVGDQSWPVWREVIQTWMDREMMLGQEEKERVWWGTGVEAYDIDTKVLT